jgi:acyl-coenzyme A thioesterase PaaI-like protein
MGDETNGKVYLPHSKPCFVCGENNEAGLQTRFFVEGDDVKAILRPRDHHCGFPNVVHGGIVASILDEAMGWSAARAIGFMCFTAELTVRYLMPVPGDRDAIVQTRVTRSTRRLAEVEGEIVSLEGEEYGRATGRFMPISPEETLKVDDGLIYQGTCERIFDTLRAETEQSAE